MTQLARLFLRGSLSHSLKSLNHKQKQEIEDIVEMVVRDPNLQNTKHEFCNALRRTIRSEYMDKDVALGDYYIAIMRAALAAKHGWGSHEPVEGVLTDSLQRKKWFQTWAFQFLRQILRENKIPSYKQSKIVSLPADEAAIEEIRNYIAAAIRDNANQDRATLRQIEKSIVLEEDGNKSYLYLDQWSIPLDILYGLYEISEKYLTYNIRISFEPDRMVIEPLGDSLPNLSVRQRRDVRVRFVSFEAKKDEDDDGHRYFLELEVSELKNDMEHESDVVESDSIQALRESLPDDAREVLNLIIDPPGDYVEKYGTVFRKKHVAEYLEATGGEVKDLIKKIKVHAMSLGLGLGL